VFFHSLREDGPRFASPRPEDPDAAGAQQPAIQKRRPGRAIGLIGGQAFPPVDPADPTLAAIILAEGGRLKVLGLEWDQLDLSHFVTWSLQTRARRVKGSGLSCTT